MLTVLSAITALALGGVLTLSGYIVGRARTLRDGEGYLAGRMAGIRDGRTEGLRERDTLREERDDVLAQLHMLQSAIGRTVDAAYEEAREVNR